MSKHIEITVKRTRVVIESAVLDFAEEDLKGLDNDDFAEIADIEGLWVTEDDVQTELTSEPTDSSESDEDYDFVDESDDGQLDFEVLDDSDYSDDSDMDGDL